MNLHGHDIGVCSWSLQPRDLDDLLTRLRPLGLWHVQLALADFVAADEPAREAMVKTASTAGLTLTAGMINFDGEDYTTIASIRRTGGYAPSDAWEKRKSTTVSSGKVASSLGIKLLSTHVGFIPMSSDPNYRVMVERVGEIASELDKLGITFLMETGQESASELLQFINDLSARNIGVNFDPANMILYGAGDPIEAIGTLGRHIRHVHVKDAIGSEHPGTKWGDEVPFGTGQVNPREFLDALKEAGYTGPLIIEREAGSDRAGDVRMAIDALKNA